MAWVGAKGCYHVLRRDTGLGTPAAWLGACTLAQCAQD
eukprot:CAMPEP_0183362902 /NCGR_PEP_ID=MMETSP0164_2-20130417/72218_1 /TAXON_ID=221442 /ORGANISM="Coccolithus pelagicus ssp braarudi, Strain PLY182g" /LENGTH=37 /DNA_ID= /DNA_START= /DNA_END= /DNA_ORIENTATION=